MEQYNTTTITTIIIILYIIKINHFNIYVCMDVCKIKYWVRSEITNEDLKKKVRKKNKVNQITWLRPEHSISSGKIKKRTEQSIKAD